MRSSNREKSDRNQKFTSLLCVTEILVWKIALISNVGDLYAEIDTEQEYL